MSILKNITGTHHNPQTLEKTIDYCCELYKTGDGEFIAYLGCSKNDPTGSMVAIKRSYKKEIKRQFEESMMSVSPAGNQYSNDEMLGIGVECAQFWFRKGFQCIVALHLDHEFRHFHIIINSVSYVDGKKLDIDLKMYNAYKTHCSRILHNYGLDPIRTPAAKIIDKNPHNFEEDLDFFEDYDAIMEDNAACLYDMCKETPSLGYTPSMTEEDEKKYSINPDAPTSNGPNYFFFMNDANYRDYWMYRSDYVDQTRLNWPYPYFEPQAVRPLQISETDFLPEPVIIRETARESSVQDEFYFKNNGVVIRINCSRQYETEVPIGYTESQVKSIIENLPRLSEAEMNKHSKRALAASKKLKDYHIDGQVELDFSETIKFNWSDGTSSTMPRITFSDESDSDVIEVDGEVID